jgi:signal transduction histidine kinase
VVAILLSIVAARRLVTTLSKLSIAAEQLGGSGDALALPLQGPREVRTTTDAFNRMQERLRRFNADRTRMIAAMSHDLPTPLTRLRLRAEMLGDIEAKNKMLNELDTMNSIMASALTFARDDAQQEPKELVDLSALTEGICLDAADAGEPVTFSGPAGVTIQCRPAAIRRAITNHRQRSKIQKEGNCIAGRRAQAGCNNGRRRRTRYSAKRAAKGIRSILSTGVVAKCGHGRGGLGIVGGTVNCVGARR